MRDTESTIKQGLRFFFISFLFGVIIHSQALFFNTDATDSIRAYGSTQAQAGSGRFIGHILDLVFEYFGFYQPFRFVNVLLYLALTAACAVILVCLFELENRAAGAMISAVIMSCAMNSGILAYFYVSYMYGFALLLSMTACWFLLKKRAVILPAILLAVSLGIYQAFLPTVILVVFLYQFLKMTRKETMVREWISETLQAVLVTAAGLGIYILSNKFYLNLTGLSMSGYANMGDNVLPSYSLSGLAGLVVKSYRFLLGLPVTDTYFISDNAVIRVCIGFFLCLLAAELIWFLVRAESRTKRLLLAAMILALPCMINLPMFIQEDIGERLSLNWYFVFIIPLIFGSRIMEQDSGRATDPEKTTERGKTAGRGRRILVWMPALTVFFLAGAVGYTIYRNVNIYSSYSKSHEIAEHIVLDLEQRITACEGFSMEDEIIFVGNLSTKTVNKYFFNVEYEGFLSKLFNRDHSSVFARYAVHEYRIIIPDDERVESFSLEEIAAMEPGELEQYRYFCVRNLHSGYPAIHSADEEIREMPSYPSAGCVRKTGGIVVCKLSD